MIEYTDEQAAIDVIAAQDSVAIVTAIRAIAESDRTQEEKDSLFRNEGHLVIKMAKDKFVAALSVSQKGVIDGFKL
mgnify:FL=1|tara:strand:- start:1006 stop:1233 length:228 start_codon:yes stop_codon:yes gene_type:complete